jgi:2-hydroxy-3-keto-5-methylthiopentenyl-1-phosphate phosphatase
MNFCCAPIVLIDFDQTITLKDTIGVLGEFGIAKNNYSKPWSYFVDSYLEDYRGHQAHLPDLPTNSSFKDFVQQLDSYKPVEKASLARVSQHKVFGGLSRHDFVQKGKRLRETLLQPNVISTLKQYKENVRIVSLNWSKDWILGFVSELGLAREQIYSNDVVFVNGTCTGEITPSILTPGDKQSLIKREIINTNQKVIYIGDSLGDIEALGSFFLFKMLHFIN